MRVGLIGPYPPPRGGVSVHINRLEEALREQGVTVTIFDCDRARNSGGRFVKKLSKIRWLFQFLICPRVDIFHIHSSLWRDRASIILIAKIRKMKTVLTLHSLRDELDKKHILQSMYVAYAINHADYIIAVGENEKNKLVKQFNCEARLSILPAFIPPRRVNLELPEYIFEFIRNHGFIISANGSNLNFYQGLDIYGLDMLVELCSWLNREIKVGFIYCLSRVTNTVYYEKIWDRIRELHLEDSFLIVTENFELWPILEKSHLFVRPSCTDSYGVSVAEALSLGIPSIASDVCKRPEGSILFKNRNSEDLQTKIREVIMNYDLHRISVQNVQIEDCTPSILKIYQNLV